VTRTFKTGEMKVSVAANLLLPPLWHRTSVRCLCYPHYRSPYTVPIVANSTFIWW